MITNIFIVSFTALWTLLNFIILLFGYLKDKTQNTQKIHPTNIIHAQPGISINSNAQLSTLNLAENIKSQNSLQPKYSQNFNYDQGMDEIIQYTPSVNQTPQNFIRTPQHEQQKASQTPQNYTRKRRTTAKQTQLRMPNGEIVSTFSFKRAQKTRYTAVTIQQQKRQSTDFNTEMQQFDDQSPMHQLYSSEQRYPPSQNSRNRTFNQVFPQQELQIEQPQQNAKKYVRLNQFCYIILKKKKYLNRTFQIYVIYFRTIICLDLVGFLLQFNLTEISIHLIYTIGLLFIVIARIVDYHLLKQINNNIHQKVLRFAFIIFWILSIFGILYLLLFQQIDDILWLYLFAPSFLLDMILLDIIKYVIITKCYQNIRQTPSNLGKIDVARILNTIK